MGLEGCLGPSLLLRGLLGLGQPSHWYSSKDLGLSSRSTLSWPLLLKLGWYIGIVNKLVWRVARSRMAVCHGGGWSLRKVDTDATRRVRNKDKHFSPLSVAI